MSKDVIIAGAIAVGCIALIAVAFIAPKSKSTESETPKTDVTTTINDPTFPGSGPGTTPGLDPNAFNQTNPPGTSPGFPPISSLPPGTSPGFPQIGTPPTSSTSSFNTTLTGPLVPPVAIEQPPAAAEAKTHTVASGELLGDIALKYYGSAKSWKKIQDANPGLDPKNLKVGQKLAIPAAETKAADTAVVTPGAGEKTYTVKSGDTLYVIAKKELGSASRWKEIEKLNGLTSNELRVGQVIKLPVAGAGSATGTAPDAAPAAGGKTHTVAKGETLGDISQKYFGTSKSWKKIADANPGVSPENLKVGQKLVIPEAPGAAQPAGGTAVEAPTAGEYTVKSGDTFGTIALKELGSKNRWKEIQEANPGLDPRNLRAGQKIKIPGKAAAPVAPAPAPAGPVHSAPGAGFGAPAPGAGFGAPANPNGFGAPAGGGAAPGGNFGGPTGQNTSFPSDPSFSSPYGAGGFGQPAQPFGQTGPGFSQTGGPAPEPFPGTQPAPFGGPGPGAGFPPAGSTDQALR